MQSHTVHWNFYLLVVVCLGITVLIHVQVMKLRHTGKNTVVWILIQTVITMLKNKIIMLVHEGIILSGEGVSCSKQGRIIKEKKMLTF